MFPRTAERIGRWLLLAMPTLLGLVFYPDLESPFTDVKAALFLVTAGVVVCCAAISGRGFVGANYVRWIELAGVCLAASAIVASLASPWRYLTSAGATWFVCGYLFFVSLRVLLQGRSWRLLRAIAIAGTAATLVSVIQYIFGLDLFRLFGTSSVAPGRMMIYGTLGNPDWLGAFLALTLPASIALAIVDGGGKRAVWVGASVLSFLMTVASGSRASVLAAALSAATLLIFRDKQVVRWSVVALALAAVLFTMFAPRALNRRSTATALLGRTVIWRTAVSPPSPNAAVGSGPNTFSYLYPLRMGSYFAQHPSDVRFASYERHAQNDFVEAYAEMGVVGLGCLLGLGAAWAVHAMRMRRQSSAQRLLAEASLSGLVALSVLACFDFPLHRGETWALAWMWLGLTLLEENAIVQGNSSRTVPRIAAATAFLIVCLNLGVRQLVASHRVSVAQQRESIGDLQSAEQSLRRSIETWDNNATAQFDLVRILAKQERYADALAQSQRAERWIMEPELFLLRGRVLNAMGREVEAMSLLEKSAKRFPYSEDLRQESAGFSQAPSGSVAPR